jgi:hypothetical protein
MAAKDKNTERVKGKHPGIKDVRRALETVKYRGFRFKFTDEQLVSLTVLWKQMGAVPKKKPARWLKTELAKEFMLHLQEESNSVDKQLLKIQREPDGGTFGHWKLALAYTAFLSPKIKEAFVSVARDRFESEDDVDQAVRYYAQATDNFGTNREN